SKQWDQRQDLHIDLHGSATNASSMITLGGSNACYARCIHRFVEEIVWFGHRATIACAQSEKRRTRAEQQLRRRIRTLIAGLCKDLIRCETLSKKNPNA